MQRWKFDAAREMRSNPTWYENRLWQKLRKRQLMGLHFRRQAPLFGYIVDFLCVGAALVVEVDGAVHDEQLAYDARRDEQLEECGYTVLRFDNEIVEADLAWVLEHIAATAQIPVQEA